MIVTVDRGFGDIRRYPPGTHPGMVVVHARNLRTSTILMLVATLLTDHDFAEFVGRNVVVEPGALRIRRPPAE